VFDETNGCQEEQVDLG
jgi:hypothetical protein